MNVISDFSDITVSWGVDKRQVRSFWSSHVEVRILPPQPLSAHDEGGDGKIGEHSYSRFLLLNKQ